MIDLATLRPTQAEPVWTAAATGKYPPKNGVRSEFVYLVERRRARSGRPAARLLLRAGAAVPGVCARGAADRDVTARAADVGHPRRLHRPVRHRQLAADAAGGDRDAAIWSAMRSTRPPVRRFDPTTRAPATRRPPWTSPRRCSTAGSRPRGRTCCRRSPAAEQRAGRLRRARWDRAYAESEAELTRFFAPRLTALRLEAVDELGHAFLREAEPEPCSATSAAATPQRSLLDRYYAFLDGRIERAIDQTEPGDLLIVVSGFGMERNAAGQAAARAADRRGGNHWLARGGARRLPHRLRRARAARRIPARIGRRPRADGALLHGPPDRPRHGRLRAHRSVPEHVHAGASGDVHADA